MKKFRGEGGAYVLGVPARDLTADEWDALTDDERDRAERSGYYEDAPDPAGRTAASKPADGKAKKGAKNGE